MNNTPLVSIIMAFKDTESYLPDCLDSIISQSYTNWELIAINDHSTDKSTEILEAYCQRDSRIKLVHSDRRKLIPSLKYGQPFMQGELINRMDSDDKMPDYKLEVLVNEWEIHGKGTIIAGGTEHFVDEGEVGDGFRRYEKWLNDIAKNNLHYQEIYKECVIPSHCWIIHRDDFFSVDGFNPEVYPEDYDLCFRFYRFGLKVVGIDKILHHWRDRSNRISRTWEEYKDNRYLELKLKYFYELDRDTSRPLLIWGGGRNGKDFAKLVLKREEKFHWVCDNPQKIGRDIYGIIMEDCSNVNQMDNPQIVVLVSNPTENGKIRQQLLQWGKKPVKDFWFFS